MKMARTITLVLLGGGVVLGGAAMLGGGTGNRDRQRECQAARAAEPPRCRADLRRGAVLLDTDGRRRVVVPRAHRHRPAALPWPGPAASAAMPGTSSRGGFGSIARGFSSSGG